MNENIQKLVDDYLDGTADDAAVDRLDELIRSDPAARQMLLRSAALDDAMRPTVGSCKECGIPERDEMIRPRFGGSAVRWVAAAAIIIAIGGWAAALLAWNGGKQDRTRLDAAQAEVASLNGKYIARCEEVSSLYSKLQTAQAEAVYLKKELAANENTIDQLQHQVAMAPEQPNTAKPRVMVLQSRGLAMALPANKIDKPTELHRYSSILYDQTLQTCPWGSLDLTCQDGTNISLDRDSEARLSQANEGKRIQAYKGIIYLTRHSQGNNNGPVSIETPHGTVEVEDAQVALAISPDHTTVEMADGKARIIDARGQATQIAAGQYAIVQPNSQVKPVNGRLEWKLEPMKSPQR